MPLEPPGPNPAAWRMATIAPEQDRFVLHVQPV
jgi:hypothetical protein